MRSAVAQKIIRDREDTYSHILHHLPYYYTNTLLQNHLHCREQLSTSIMYIYELYDKTNEIIQKLRDEFNALESNNSNKSTQVAEPSDQTIPFPDSESSLRSQKQYRQHRQI
jgi:hypothetical protein